MMLLLLCFISAFATNFEIDCDTLDPVTVLSTDKCQGTYRSVTDNDQGYDSDQAFEAWLHYCVYGGPGIELGAGDSVTLTGDCYFDGDYYIYFDETFDGNFTFRGDKATLMIGASSEPLIYIGSNSDTPFQNSFVIFSDLEITSDNYNSEAFVYADQGNVILRNLVLKDIMADDLGVLLYHDGLREDENKRFIIEVDNVEVTQENGVILEAPLLIIENGNDVRISNLNIHDLEHIYPILWMENYGFIPSSTDVTISDVTVHNVTFNDSDGGYLAYFTGETQDFTIDIGSVSFSEFYSNTEYPLIDLGFEYAYVTGSFSLHDSSFNDLTLRNTDTAIYIEGRETVQIDSLNVTNVVLFSSSGWMTFIGIDNTNGATISNSFFANNSGHAQGLVYLDYTTSNAIISGNTFYNNVATTKRPFPSYGGAMSIGGSAYFENNVFDSNTADNGGAVFVNDVDASFTDCEFNNNVAHSDLYRTYSVGYGGAICRNIEGTLSVTACSFEGNTAMVGGGAIAAIVDEDLAHTEYNFDGGDVMLSMCTFDSNTATTGGALHFHARGLMVSDTNFSNNNATAGGAVSSLDINPFVSTPIVFRNTMFSSNRAFGGDVNDTIIRDGGAIASYRSVQVNGVVFEGNVAEDGNGGAVTAYKGFDAEYSTFTGNSANGKGGALWSDPVQAQPIRLFRSGFDTNTAEEGGAVYSNNPATLFDGVTFQENSATQGGAAYLATDATISSTGFQGNAAELDGGAVYSLGDVTISASRFVSNTALNGDGGAVNCYSNPLGQVDFTLRMAQAFFYDNTAGGLGAHIDSTCNLVDVGSVFETGTHSEEGNDVECVGDKRVLRQCEFTFTGTKFTNVAFGVYAPSADTLQKFSSGLNFDSCTFSSFSGFLQAEQNNIKDCEFELSTLVVESPTTVSSSLFINCDDNYLDGEVQFQGDEWRQSNLNVSLGKWVDSSFETSTISLFQATMTDVTISIASAVVVYDTSSFTRVTVDETSSFDAETSISVYDWMIAGAFTQGEGALDLTGTFTIGGEGLNATLNVPVTGSGDLVVSGGYFKWTGGDISGDGKLILQAGNAELSSGRVLDRTTTASDDAVVWVSGSPAFTLTKNFDAKGGVHFEDDAHIASAGDESAFNTWKNVHFGMNTIIDPPSKNYGNYWFNITEPGTYESVTFGSSWFTVNTSVVTAIDARPGFLYEDLDVGNGTVIRTDIGYRFTIITLPYIWDIPRLGAYPFGGVSYVYNETYQYPDADHAGAPHARVSNRAEDSDAATNYMYLYSSASTFSPLGMVFLVVLALLF
jgi:predicted outer membrane repeat protein